MPDKPNVLTVPPVTSTMQAVGDMGQDEKLEKKIIPLSGKWSPSEDPTMIQNDFATLTNLRYTDTHPQAVQGMTKINTTALTSDIDNMFQFIKSQPDESHLLVHAGDKVYVNEAAVPATGDFEATQLWTDASGSLEGRFSNAPNGELVYCNGEELCVYSGNEVSIGAVMTAEAEVTAGTVTNPRDYSSVISNTIQTVAQSANVSTPALYILVGSRRPVKGIKFYILSGHANTTTSTLTCKYWSGSAWTAVSGESDGTTSGGKALAQTGSYTFTSTAASSKIKYLNGYILHWYQFILSAGTAKIYHITCDAPFQALTDLWDGANRSEYECYLYDGTSTVSYATNVYDDSYSSSDTATYMDLATWVAATDYILVGFAERMMGLEIGVASDHLNAAASVMSVYYSDGTSTFVSVGTIADTTSDGGKSLATSGNVTWSPLDEGLEFVRVEKGLTPLYYYKVKFSAALTNNVRITYIAGISAPTTLPKYKFSFYGGNRVFLCNEMSGKHNVAKHSAVYTTQVFNGDDSMDIEFGGDEALTAACSIFAQYGASLYNMNLFFKETETWALVGSGTEDWVRYQMSGIEGCPAPHTLCTFHLPVETHTGLNRNVAIWQGNNGIYISDGRSPVPIHHDIRKYFDPSDSDCINSSYLTSSRGFIDRKNYEYHWIFYSGSGATLTEFVFDYRRWKWYRMNRGTSNALQCGMTVTDSGAESYPYGAVGGYVVRLNNGTQFAGVTTSDITCTLQMGDVALIDGDPFIETMIRHFELGMVSKTSTANTVAATHYLDTCNTATSTTWTLAPQKSGYRVAVPLKNANLGPGLFHSLKFTMTTSNETAGFEPLYIGIAYRQVRDRLTAS